MARVAIQITKPTVVSGQRVQPGDVVETEAHIGLYVCALGKAVNLGNAGAAKGMSTATAGALVDAGEPGAGHDVDDDAAEADEVDAAPAEIPEEAKKSKSSLEAWARRVLGLELDRRKRKDDLVAECEDALAERSAETD